MTTTIDIRDLPNRIDEAIALASAGNEVILTDGTNPRARLVPCVASSTRVAGLHSGTIQTAADFDAPLPEEFWMGRP